VIFGEHRYFGESYPYDPSIAFTPEHNIYLTVEQAMMDYVMLIQYIRETYSMEDKACVVFGGSYGGMLAGWLRQKYPHVFQGALSCSGPSVYFKDAPSAPEMAYSMVATNDFKGALDKSPSLIRESFERLVNQTNNTESWAEISEIFNTCDVINETLNIHNLYLHLSNGYQYLCMTDYPYPASFLEPMPGFPVNVSASMWENVTTDGSDDPTAAIG